VKRSAADARRQKVEQLRHRFGWTGPAPRATKPALILLSGLPGTGKSFLAEAVRQRYPVVVLRSDEVRKELYPLPRYTPTENGAVYLICYALVEALLRDRYAVVFDATNLIRRGRRRARALADAVGAPFLVLVTVSPPDVVAERLRRRAAGETATYSSDADWLVHEKLAGTMEAIAPSNEPALIVDTSINLQPAFDALEALLSSTA
jgi:hypothetical protein